MAKKSSRRKGRKGTPSTRPAGARASARTGAGARKTSTARRNTGRRTGGAKTPKRKAARKKATNPPRRAKTKAQGKRQAAKGTRQKAKVRAARPRRQGGTGREETLAQTPETGRSVKGRTNPMPTRRSTGTAAGAGNTRSAPGLERARRQLREVEESVPTPPSSLDMNRGPSAARSGRQELREAREEHTETSPAMTGGDVDADWQDAYAVGDEAPGGDNPTPDQDRVDDIGKALGVEYQDNEELKAADKIAERDRKRWELDPASSEDYKDRD